MSIWKKAFATTLLTALPIAGYPSCMGSWAQTASPSNWSDVGNWNPNGCSPDVPGSVFTNSGTFADAFSNFGLVPVVHYFPNSVLVNFVLPQTTYLNYVEGVYSSINHVNLRLNRQMAQLRRRFTGPNVKFAEMTALAEEVLLAENSPELNPQVEEKQEQLKERIGEPCRPWSFYFGPTGDVGRVLTKRQATGYHYDRVGAQAGFDYAFSDLGVGFLADYDYFDGRGDHHWGKFNINQAHGSVYATYIRHPEPQLSFNLILGGGYEWYDIRRNTVTGVAKANPQGVEFDALAGMEYTFEKKDCECMTDHWQVVPQLSLQYMYVHVNGYQEHGARILDLKYRSQNVRSLRSILGTRINYSWNWTHVVFTPEINLEWQWEFLDKNRHIHTSALGMSPQLTMGQPGRNVALGGIDLLFTLYDKYGIEASYDCQWNALYLDHFFYVGCSFKF